MRSVAVLFCLGCAGCGAPAPGPPTYPAGGLVQHASGEPFAGGSIEFRSQADPSLCSLGVIGDDGKFTLYTLAGAAKVAGALAGTHQVTVAAKMTGKQRLVTYVLARTYEIQADHDNQLTIIVDPADRQ